MAQEAEQHDRNELRAQTITPPPQASLPSSPPPRVRSRGLFKYECAGVLDPDSPVVVEQQQKLTAEGLQSYRQAVANAKHHHSSDPLMAAAVAACDHSEISVPGHGTEIRVLVHKPRALPVEGNACLVYAHGGSGIADDAESSRHLSSLYAVKGGVVVFNVDYRLAPEHTGRHAAVDLYCVIRTIFKEHAAFGVDADKIALAGEDGGGHACYLCCTLLAQRRESFMVSLAMPMCGMICEYFAKEPLDQMTGEEAFLEQHEQPFIRESLAGGAANCERALITKDPKIFPTFVSDDDLAWYPPILIWQAEFDCFATPNQHFAERLAAAQRLLEHVVYPGVKHCFWNKPQQNSSARASDFFRDWGEALEAYLEATPSLTAGLHSAPSGQVSEEPASAAVPSAPVFDASATSATIAPAAAATAARPPASSPRSGAVPRSASSPRSTAKPAPGEPSVKWQDSLAAWSWVLDSRGDTCYQEIMGSRPKFGEGREQVPGGGFYEGPFRFGKRDGDGVLVSDDSGAERYEGQFKADHIEGFGCKVLADGSNYKGFWRQNRKDGEGILEEKNGRRYIGQWLDGKRHGVGTQVFDASTSYQGRWENGLQHGTGKYIDNNAGTVFEGKWNRGAHHGPGVVRKQDGRKEKRLYCQGMLTEQEDLAAPTVYPPLPRLSPVTA